MATLPLQFPAKRGDVAFTPADAAGDAFDNANGASRLWGYNSAGVEKRIRLKAQRADSAQLLVDLDLRLDPGSALPLEEIPAYRFNEPGTSLVRVEYPDGAAGLAVAAEGKVL